MKQVILCISMLLAAVPAVAQAPRVPGLQLAASDPPRNARQPASAETDTGALADLVAELERHNPELSAARREVDMHVARIAPAGAPPDPMISAGYMGGIARPFFPSSRTQGAFQQVGASQEIPFPGKLALRTRIAATEADAERWNYEDRRRRLIADLKVAYFEYELVGRSIEIVLRNKELLEQLRQIAETRFRVGRGIQQDVLKAQLEISLLLERLEQLEQQRIALQAEINGLLYRPPGTPLPATLMYRAVEAPPEVERLHPLVGTAYPALKRDEQIINRGQQGLALARRELLPDLAISVTSQRFTGEMPWMYGVDVMVTVPLFWQRKQRPMIAEAAAALESGRRMRDSTLSMAMAGVTAAHAAARTSRRLAQLYSDSVLPQARLALESSLAAYQVGSVDFLTMLANFVTLLTYEVAYEEQTARYHQALARLEPLVGLELVQ
jgi:outer membrane protein, heavy metal efflux system